MKSEWIHRLSWKLTGSALGDKLLIALHGCQSMSVWRRPSHEFCFMSIHVHVSLLVSSGLSLQILDGCPWLADANLSWVIQACNGNGHCRFHASMMQGLCFMMSGRSSPATRMTASSPRLCGWPGSYCPWQHCIPSKPSRCGEPKAIHNASHGFNISYPMPPLDWNELLPPFGEPFGTGNSIIWWMTFIDFLGFLCSTDL